MFQPIVKPVLCISLFVAAQLSAGCTKEDSRRSQTTAERGKYLVTLGGCHDCHTPKVPGPGGAPVLDASKLLSGHPENSPVPAWSPEDLKRGVLASTNSNLTAWAGPWGVSFAINLTPDKETGLAEWNEQTFIDMARTGKHHGQSNGRDILPPMPWFNLKDLTDADLKAMWAYLRSLPPIRNQVPLPVAPPQASGPSAG
ncbi:MAG TPA: c-type cytochrome [Candidatus Binatia bacterium]|jgi:mono/diheme cytochrome c family protein